MTDSKHLVDVRDIKTSFFDPVVWEQMKGMAETFRASGAFAPEENAAKLMVKIQAGREMGMSPVEAVKSFYFVKGTINIFGSAMMRRLREHGWKIEFKDEPDICTVKVSKDKESYTETLTFDEAQKSGWTHAQGKLKPGWYEGVNRRLKLRYGVISLVLKTYLPEVMGSAVDIAEVAEDMAPVIEEGVVENPDDHDPASTDQLDTLKTLGVETPDNLTKAQARELIIKETK